MIWIKQSYQLNSRRFAEGEYIDGCRP